jgi:hypothetical protein
MNKITAYRPQWSRKFVGQAQNRSPPTGRAGLVSIGKFQSRFQQGWAMKLVRALPMEEIESLG